jgi:5' nucleotidase, deoxy (Pyrimidine), cytosolic type C protein (NT5C)
MTTLRIGFDMDGVLADFGSAFREIERELFGAAATDRPVAPEDEEKDTSDANTNALAGVEEVDRRDHAVWQRIRATEDFWTTLRPTDPQAVRRLHSLTLQHRWEVVFITQRPSTAGETVQRQTQRWLTQQGFDLPSVLVIAGSRGMAANALRLDYQVDDSPRNCLDVKADSTAMPILIVQAPQDVSARQARKLGMRVACSIGECLDVLEQASRDRQRRQSPGVLRRLASLVNWNA